MSLPGILILEQSAALGGGQLALLDLLPALSEVFAPLVAVPAAGPLTARLDQLGMPWRKWPLGAYSSGRKMLPDLARFAARFPRSVAWTRRAARQARAALILANGPRAFPAAAIAARMAGIPLVWHLQVEVVSRRDRLLCRAAAAIGRPGVIACSQRCLECFPSTSRLRRGARVVYPGVAPVSGKRTRPGDARPLAGVVGRLHPDKGQDLLVFAPLSGIDVRFIGADSPTDLVSAIYTQQLKRAVAARLQENRSFEFAGWTDDIGAALADLDVLVIPSRREALARVILEAFSARIPVVAARVGGIPEVVRDGENGLLFPCDNQTALAEAVRCAVQNTAMRREIVAQAAQDYERHFRLERFREEMISALREASRR